MVRDSHKARPGAYALALAACLFAAGLATFLHEFLDLVNIVMLFLLTVFLVARWLGRGPAVMAAFLSVAFFDLFFVPPRFSFAVSDVQYLVTFVVMLAIGLVTAELTAGLRRQAEAARQKEAQAHGLYDVAKDLAGVIDQEHLEAALGQYLKGLGFQATLHLLDDGGHLPSLADKPLQLRLALMAVAQQEPVEMDDPGDVSRLVMPLKGTMRVRGVMVIGADDPENLASDRQLLGTLASLVALTLERLHYVEVAQASQIEVTSERLRSSVLSVLSHDLRTPLTALVGMSDSLALSRDGMSEAARGMAAAIRDQARAMSHLLANVLDMARLHAGKVHLRREWQLFEDVISASLHLLQSTLENRPIQVSLPPEMPLVEFDAVLLERVVFNLLENAAKYSPAGTPIEIRAFVEADQAGIAVCDHGRGFPPGRVERVFGMFERGEPESATPGVGLGLAICRAIVEAHGGTITAINRPEGGACVTFRLPLGIPPAIEAEPIEIQEETKP